MENSFQLLNTKTIIPSLPNNLVNRQGLVNKLDSDPKAKLILVCAPAGYGKSTLVNSWLKHKQAKNSGMGVAWFTIDQQDDDPALFFSYLVKAVQQVNCGTSITAQSLLAYPEAGLESLVAALVNDLVQLDHQVKIILDDYQYITENAVHQAVNYLLEHLPGNVQLIITSREIPPLSLHRLRAYCQLIEIDRDDLKFSLAETASYLKNFMGLTLTHEAIQCILQKTEGWVAGLQIAALSIKSRMRHGTCSVDTFPRLIESNAVTHEYFFNEVFNRQPEYLRSFLLKTCVLDILCGPLCDALAGIDNSTEILDQLTRSNNFVTRVDDSGQWYRYHVLFARFLLSLLNQEEIAALQIEASRWHEKNGMPIEAVQYALAAGGEARAGQVLANHAADLLFKGEFPLLAKWLEKLPPEVICQHDVLCTINIWIHYHKGKGSEVDRFLKAYEQQPIDRSLGYMAIKSEILNSKGQVEDALQTIQQALAIQKQAGSDDCSTLNLYGISLYLSGCYLDAVTVLQRSLQLADEQKNLMIKSLTLFQLAKLFYQQGHPQYTLHLCREFVSAEGAPPSIFAGFGLIPMGLVYYETNQLENASACVDDGLRYARDFGVLKPLILGKLLQAKLAFLRKDQEQTHQILYDALALANAFGHIEYRLMAAAEGAELSQRMGNMEAARVYLDLAGVELDRAHEPLFELFDLAAARYLIVQNHPKGALEVLKELEARMLPNKRNGLLLRVHILQARAYYHMGCYAEAFHCMEKGVKLAAPIHYMRSFLDQEADMPALLPVIQDVEPEFVGSLLKEMAVNSEYNAPAISPQLFDHLSKREYDILNLVMENCSNKEIASRLFISVGTTKWHLNSIYKKMGVKNREEVIALVKRLQAGMLTHPLT